MAKQKYYVVWKGRAPGVYNSWEECKAQIDKFTGALYKAFEDQTLAAKAFNEAPHHHFRLKSKQSKASRHTVGFPIQNSISVDAACSGNPGKLEYQGVQTSTGANLFHLGPFPEGTVNLGEFLAIVHGLAFLKKRKSKLPIYTDSITAMKWVRDRKVNTKLERNKKNEELFKLVDRGIKWLKKNEYPNVIIKWKTDVWGEIPADFGRK